MVLVRMRNERGEPDGEDEFDVTGVMDGEVEDGDVDAWDGVDGMEGDGVSFTGVTAADTVGGSGPSSSAAPGGNDVWVGVLGCDSEFFFRVNMAVNSSYC